MSGETINTSLESETSNIIAEFSYILCILLYVRTLVGPYCCPHDFDFSDNAFADDGDE